MNVKRIAAILAIAAYLSGCSAPIKIVPDKLVGVWNTDAPKYADRYFQLKKDAVIFAVGNGKVTMNAVLQVNESREKTQDLYEISYLTQEGTTQKFSFYYDPPTSTIRIKSQEKMNWKKASDGDSVVKAAAHVPAATLPTVAKQPLPVPAKESKKPAASVAAEIPVTVLSDGSTGPHRDPFSTLRKQAPPSAQPIVLPPGKRGILISQAKLEGVVKTAGGMIAVVSGSNRGTYFLHTNDLVFNGRVARITVDSIVFEETSVDPYGKSIGREVVKKLAGEK